MGFLDLEHQARIRRLEQHWNDLEPLRGMAKEFGIADIFQDNGAKTLQQLIYLNMKLLPGREGNDSVSENGVEWEMKSINLATRATGFSTNHHTTNQILSKFRRVPWTFAIYRGIELQEIYIMSSSMLEPQFSRWEQKLLTQTHINNPKIPVKFVKENGIKVFPINKVNPIDPSSIIDLQ